MRIRRAPFLALVVVAASVLAAAIEIKSGSAIAMADGTSSSFLSTLSREVEQLFSSQTASLLASSVPDQAVVSLSGELPPHDATVGTAQGTAGVSGGSATYNIPFVLPPGRKGMQPSFSLSYSSRAGNGVAGMGWSVSGLSSISRCPSTIEQDGLIRPVDFTTADKLCLDGQRLVATSGTYGAVNAVYATEIDSFARITQLGGNLANAGTYFKVEYKSGEISYFGGTSTAANNARVVPGGLVAPISWLIERQLDRIGNNVIYTYTNFGNGEVEPAAVYYTGFNTTQGDRRIQFTYETRPTVGANDQSSSYMAGGLMRQTQRLKTVSTFVATEAVREYRLSYGISASSSRSLLSSLQECAYVGATATCRPATQFQWQQAAMKSTLHPAVLPSGYAPIRMVGDLNGDGAREMLAKGPDGHGYYISVGGDRQIISSLDASGLQPGNLIPTYSYGSENADFDKDGKADILGTDGSGNLTIAFWDGPANASTYSQAFTRIWNTGIHAVMATYVGDADGDGRSDLGIVVANGGGPNSCLNKFQIFRNVPNVSGGSLPSTFPLAVEVCLATTYNAGFPFSETFQYAKDLNGDGLADFLFAGPAINVPEKTSFIMYGQRSPTYALTRKNFDTIFPASDPISNQESSAYSMKMWMDVNGDGLEDWVYARAASNTSGKWTLRLNTGNGLGARINLNESNGIEFCARKDVAPATCGTAWRPWYSGRMQLADVDGDGRPEVLVPRHFASRICAQLFNDAGGGVGQTGPGQPGSGQTLVPRSGQPDQPRPIGRRQRSDKGSRGPVISALPSGYYYSCPEDPMTGQLGFSPPTESASVNGNTSIVAMYWQGQDGAGGDVSAYLMGALHFVETGPNQFQVVETQTDIVQGYGYLGFEDAYGDGLADNFTGFDARPATSPDAYGPLASTIPGVGSPATLPGGYSIFAPEMFINENQGPGGATNPDGKTPQTPDMLSMVTDGLGKQTIWTYYPLSSKAGRSASETPLYSLPSDPAGRYIDERHIYFASSMQVVSEMSESDGNGGFHTNSYGYSEAMYNQYGRGFQGFHKIIVEDEANEVRTTTIFHQKYPLTSQIDQVIVNSTRRSGTDAPFSVQTNTWRCNRANRSDTAACGVTVGSNPVRFPYLDSTDTRTYDVAAAENPTGGTPKEIGRVLEVNADDTTCAGAFATASGFDAYGNLTAKTVHRYDSGDGTPGFNIYVADQCQRTRNTFAAADTANWWLNKLTQTVATSQVSYAAGHALPSGVSNPIQTVTTAFTWNANRTPATETVQPGVANQEKVTTYSYPTSNNYGLPLSVSIVASGDPNGARVTGTTYSSDGYFPLTVTNALGHTASTAVRLRDGQPSLTVDANGLRTTVEYDAFGLPIHTMYRAQSDSAYVAPDKYFSLSWCNNTCEPNSRALYKSTEVQDGSPVSIVAFDLLGRTLLTAQRLMDGTLPRVQTQYNARGLVAQRSEPYLANPTVWTQFTNYDSLGRVTRKVVPKQLNDGRGDMVTQYFYTGRTTDIQVCGSADVGTSSCLAMSRSTDSLGRFMGTVDALGGQTDFWFGGSGNAIALRDANSVVTKASYNALGQRTQVQDPNQGTWNFAYNALGEVLSQTDARGIVTSYSYDKLGRRTQRSASIDITGDNVADSILDTWTYDPLNALGSPATSTRKVNNVVERSQTPTYDTLARPIQVDTTQNIGGSTKAYTQTTAYDGYYGRAKAQGYPNGETLRLQYANYGQLNRESDAGTGLDYRIVNSVDLRGQVTGETLGAVTGSFSYAPTTGQITQIRYQQGATTLRTLDYQYDVFGNLSRQTLNGNTSEALTYDMLHRLKQSVRTGGASGVVTYDYDAVGNFKYKSDFSTSASNAYGYTGSCGGGPNAVKSVITSSGTRTYCYDANGNMVSDSAGFSARYDHTNHPVTTQRNTNIDTLYYGANDERTRITGSDGTRIDLGSYEDVLTAGETKAYLGDYAVITTTASTRTVAYLLKDRLGSVDAVASTAGALTETRGYDAFGAPRQGTWADASPVRLASTATTPRGFTQHEHLNNIELIHMGGRAYDYRLGRFLSVDPLIQSPLNSQSLNPYSYVLNNPLSATDPTGYSCNAVTLGADSCGDPVDGQDTDPKNGHQDSATGDKFHMACGGYCTGSARPSNGASSMSAIGAQPRSSHNGAADLFSGAGRSQVCGPNDPTGEARATVRTPGEEFNKRFDDMVDELPLLSDGGKEGVHALTDTAVSGWAAGKDGHYLKASGLLMLSVLQVVQPETKGASPLIRGAEEGLSAAKGAIGATGKVGEAALKLLGGEPQAYFKTTQGGRYVDQLVNGVANESKVGYTTLTSNIRRQISKDVELLSTGRIDGSTWHFFQSPVTGVGGPSQPLRNALQQNGISIVVH